MAVTCALLATVLVAHVSVLSVTLPAGAADAPPIVVFAEDEHRADRAPLSADAAVALQDIRSRPRGIGHSHRTLRPRRRQRTCSMRVVLSSRGFACLRRYGRDCPRLLRGRRQAQLTTNLVSVVTRRTRPRIRMLATGRPGCGRTGLGSAWRTKTWKVHPLGRPRLTTVPPLRHLAAVAGILRAGSGSR